MRGEYRFQDYKLKIVSGEVVFPESPQPDPQLKIICQKDVKDAIIQVQVTGPLKQPKLVMSSMPSMNQVDILSYLLFDRAAGDLSSKESFQLQDKAAHGLGHKPRNCSKGSSETPRLLRIPSNIGKASSSRRALRGVKTEGGCCGDWKVPHSGLVCELRKERYRGRREPGRMLNTG